MRRSGNANPFAIADNSLIKNNTLKSNLKGKWFEFDSFESGKTNKNKSINEGLSKSHITFWYIILFLGIAVLLSRVIYLQVFQGQHFSSIADGNRLRILDVKAPRGVMYDRHNTLLVENIPTFSLAIVPVDLSKDQEELEKMTAELATMATVNAVEILELIKSQPVYSYQPIVLAENLDHEKAIMARILSSKYSGVILKVNNTRNYLLNSEQQSLSHVLGYSGKINEQNLQDFLAKGYSFDDIAGKTGLEAYYETQLKGVNGKQQVEVDATGQTKDTIAFKKPIPGENLLLSIDLELQQAAEQALNKVLKSYNKKRGAVVVLDPNTGEVLAMVSLPTFNNNEFSRGISQEEFNKLINDEDRPLFSRVVSGEYPSGSTFKLIVGAAALEEGVITESTTFNSVGGIGVAQWFFPDWKFGGHGLTNIDKALAESVNTFFYIVGGGYSDFTGLGVDRINQYAQNFGLDRKLGIDLPSEAEGFLPSKAWKEETKNERWYIGDTYNMSIGQGDVLVTPLHVAAWTSVFANGGTLFQPHLVKAFLGSDGNVISEIKPVVLNENFISPEHIKIINRGLRSAVTYGSGLRFSTLPMAVAAKTGTAQWSSTKSPHGWVTAFAPYENPQIVVTVLVEEGEGGNTTAVPVAYDILNWWAQNRLNK